MADGAANNRPRVLVVDDQRGMRVTLEGILRDHGHDVATVSDGRQAIDAAKNDSYDLILMDIDMPGMDGVQALREVKKVSPDSLVVMMTGHALDQHVMDALDEGAHSVVFKPFEVDKLLDVMRAATPSGDILVVDDNDSDRKSLSALLLDRGYEVETASDGIEAVEKAKNKHYDVVMMDIRMPGKDGLAAFQEIAAIDPDTRVIFTTGFAPDEETKQTLDSGYHLVAYKPFDVASMLSMVRKLTMERAS